MTPTIVERQRRAVSVQRSRCWRGSACSSVSGSCSCSCSSPTSPSSSPRSTRSPKASSSVGISKMYETFYDGIVIQAAGATIAVFGVMLLLYRTRIIKVTNRFRKIVDHRHDRDHGVLRDLLPDPAVRRLRRRQLPLQPEPARHRLQRFVAGLAAINLALDFDFIERGSKRGSTRTSSGTPRSACWSRSSGSTSRCCGCCPSSAAGEVSTVRRGDLSRLPPGAALGGAVGSRLFGLGVPLAIVAGANGRSPDGAAYYDWSSPRGVGAFVLDSTWAGVTTAAASSPRGRHGAARLRVRARR